MRHSTNAMSTRKTLGFPFQGMEAPRWARAVLSFCIIKCNFKTVDKKNLDSVAYNSYK